MSMMRWLRRKLRERGIFLPFPAVICPRHVKAIRVAQGAGVEVSVERTLVYLESPEPGDLFDLVPLREGEGEIHQSGGSEEILRTSTPKGTVVHWAPPEPIIPYGLYVHTYGWSSPGSSDEAALYTQFRCDTRTGVAVLELSTTGKFEAAVAFRWPAWRRLWSVHTLVKHALQQLETGQGYEPETLEDGARLRWKLVSPRVGERFACVAFHQDGMALWQKRLAAETLPERARRLVRLVTSF